MARRRASRDLRIQVTSKIPPTREDSWVTLGDVLDIGQPFDGAGVFDQTDEHGFWEDVDGDAQIHRMRERLFLGDAADWPATRFPSPGGAWLPNDDAGANWAPRDSQLVVMSSRGALAITGMTRSSDGDDQNTASIGVSGFLINDSSPGRSGWALYSDVQHEAAGGTSYGIEFAIKNASGEDLTADAYHAVAGTVGIWLAAGGDDSYGPVHTNPSNSAIQVGGNSSTWNRALVVFGDGLTRTNGRACAISLGQYQSIKWTYTGNISGFTIDSGVDTNGAAVSILALNNGVYFLNASGQPIGLFYNDLVNQAEDYIYFRPGKAGTPPRVITTGSNTDIDISFQPKGAGLMKFGTYSAIGAEALAGYITVKDTAGNSRKLAVVA